MANRQALFFITLTLGLSIPTYAADTLFSSLGPSDSFSTTRPPVTGSATFFGYLSQGMRFTSPLERSLTALELALQHATGPNTYQVTLHSNAAGQPGAILESWSTAAPTVAGIVVLPSSSHPLLQAGGTYWVTVATGASNTSGGWFLNDQGLNSGGAVIQSTPGGAWSANSSADRALRVSGGVAPEPTSALLLGLGGAAALGWGHRRSRRRYC